MKAEKLDTFLTLSDPVTHGQMARELTDNRRRYYEPERELLIAALRDAFESLGQDSSAKAKRSVQRATRKWFESKEANRPFAFVAICQALNLDADAVRQRALSGQIKTRPYHRRGAYWQRNQRGDKKQVKPEAA